MEKVDSGQGFADRPLLLLVVARVWREVCMELTVGYLFKSCLLQYLLVGIVSQCELMVQNSARLVFLKPTCYVNTLSPDKKNSVGRQVQKKILWQTDLHNYKR